MEYIGLCTTRRESNQLLMKMAWRPRCTENDFNWMAASKFHITPSNNNTTAATMGGNIALKWWDCLELGAVDCGALIDTFTWGELHSAVVYLDCLCWVAVGMTHDSWGQAFQTASYPVFHFALTKTSRKTSRGHTLMSLHSVSFLLPDAFLTMSWEQGPLFAYLRSWSRNSLRINISCCFEINMLLIWDNLS